jgi:hypothetical protein
MNRDMARYCTRAKAVWPPITLAIITTAGLLLGITTTKTILLSLVLDRLLFNIGTTGLKDAAITAIVAVTIA